MSSVSRREDNNNGISYSQTGTWLDNRHEKGRQDMTPVLYSGVRWRNCRPGLSHKSIYFTRATLGLSLLTDRRWDNTSNV